jgi:type II secretory pathway component PulK
MIHSRQHSRRGVMMIAVIVCIAIASALLLTMVKQLASAKKTVDFEIRREQAAWIVEAGIQRAVIGLRDSNYTRETWTIDGRELNGDDAATVQIDVSTVSEDASRRQIEVTVQYPPGETGIRESKTIYFDLDKKESL